MHGQQNVKKCVNACSFNACSSALKKRRSLFFFNTVCTMHCVETVLYNQLYMHQNIRVHIRCQ